jgi:hypothetical protein
VRAGVEQPSPLLNDPGGQAVSEPDGIDGWDMVLGIVAMLEPLPPSMVPLVTPPSDAPVIREPRIGLAPTDGRPPDMALVPELPDSVLPLPDVPDVPDVPSSVPASVAGAAFAPAVLPSLEVPLGEDSSLPGVEAVLGARAVDGRLGREPAPVTVVCAMAAEQAAMATRARSFFIE